MLKFDPGMYHLVLALHVQLPLICAVCNQCSQSLNDICEFKYNCLKAEEIILYKLSKIRSDLKLDLRDVMLWTDNTPKPLKSSLENICRTCLRLFAKNAEDRGDSIFDILRKCVPELDSTLTLNPNICEKCEKMLYKWDYFRIVYMNTDILIKQYCSTFNIQNSQNIIGYKLLEFSKSSSWEPNNYFNLNTINCIPADEEFEFKFDYHELNVQMYTKGKEEKVVKTENTDDFKIIIQETVETVLKPMRRNGIHMYTCPKCKKIVKDIEDHLYEHGDSHVKLSYQCHKCDYRHKLKFKLREHLLSHQKESPTKMFSCPQCSFQAKQKGNLMTHMLIHKKPEEIEMFKCQMCKFQTRQKGNLKTHMLTHKKPEELEMFKCNICTYQARQKGNLQTHMLKKHRPFGDKVVEEALFYKCKQCTYKAKHKPSLKKHMRSHES
ncbi:hypothetical protein NQ318_011058 [Aromia moschata]|uniref:C2H2-type domain-containing protein n=1 Tax=Aromia moschata TaxID=1265417 RepID=A0AAV8YTL5_9CUCU|nr:hypothetical protein NQ318_011058 [Aromia moschata]